MGDPQPYNLQDYETVLIYRCRVTRDSNISVFIALLMYFCDLNSDRSAMSLLEAEIMMKIVHGRHECGLLGDFPEEPSKKMAGKKYEFLHKMQVSSFLVKNAILAERHIYVYHFCEACS